MAYLQRIPTIPSTLSPHDAARLCSHVKQSYALGEITYGEYAGLLKKIKKVARKVVAGQAGLLTLGLVKPKLLGIKSKSSQKIFKKTAKIGRIAAVVVGAVVAAPLVAPYLASAGTATMGALKFVGGKLISAPGKLIGALTGKGINPSTATPEQVLEAGQETGTVTEGMLEQAMSLIQSRSQGDAPVYPGGTSYPSRPSDQFVEGSEGAPTGGMLETLKPALPWIGAGIVAIAVLPSLLKGRSK